MKDALIQLPKDERSRTSLRSLLPEAEEGMKRVDVDISVDDCEVRVEADDTTALRAALNSYVRWLDVTQKLFDELN